MRSFVLALTLSICTFTSFINAQIDPESRPPTQELLPETTVMFMQIDNFADMALKMKESNFFQMFQHEEVAPLFEGLWDDAKLAYDENAKEEVGLDIEDFQALPKGELCFAIIAPRRKNPEFLLLLELDDETDSKDKVLNRIRDEIQEDGAEITTEESDDGIEYETFTVDDKKVKYFEKDGLLVGCTSEEELDAFVDRWMGRKVEKVRTLDPIGIAKSATRGNFAASASLNFLPIFGLDGLLGAGGSLLLSEEDFESVMHAHLLLANPRAGIFEMVAMKPTMYEPEPWIPSDVINYGTTSWDFKQLLAELTKIIENFQPIGSVDEWIEENLNETMGLDVKTDILEAVSGRVTFAQWNEEPIRLNSQLTILSLGIEDAEAFEPTLEKIVEAMNKEGSERRQNRRRVRDADGEDNDDDKPAKETNTESDETDQWIEQEYEGIRIWCFDMEVIQNAQERRRERQRQRAEEQGRPVRVTPSMNEQQPAFALVGDYLLMSQSLTAIQKAIDVDQGREPALTDNDEYVDISDTMTKLLKNEMPVAMFYSNPAEAFRMWFELAGSDETKGYFSSQLEIANAEEETPEYAKYLERFKDRLDANPLPPFDEMRKYFKPQGQIVTDDDTGFHLLWFQKRFDPDAQED